MTHDHDPVEATFEHELDQAFASEIGAPPSQFLARVRTRHHRVIATRLGASLTLFIVIIAAAFWAWPSAKPSSAPVNPILARGSTSADLPLVIGSHGRGAGDPDSAPTSGDPDIPRIRMGDGLESEAVRALLAA